MPRETIRLQLTTADGTAVVHRYTRHTDPASDRLLVLLPGQGYTVDMPLLYVLSLAASQAGWDVLAVNYGFQSQVGAPMGGLEDEVRAALSHPELERGYREMCIAGKSLGTPLAVKAARGVAVETVRLILLTPIGASVESAGDLPTLAIIGTADNAYDPDMIAATGARPNTTWKVYDGLSHSLIDRDDWRRSLLALGQTTDDCMVFLRG